MLERFHGQAHSDYPNWMWLWRCISKVGLQRLLCKLLPTQQQRPAKSTHPLDLNLPVSDMTPYIALSNAHDI